MKKKFIFCFATLLLMLLAFVFVACDSASDKKNEKEKIGKIVYTLKEDDTYEISGTFYGTDLVIPAEYNGKPVTSIKPWSFNGNDNLISVTIPKSIVEIDDDSTFRNCREFSVVNYQGTLADWCNGGFQFNLLCNGSTEKSLYIDGKLIEGHVEIPEGVTKIGDDAFRSYLRITSITIPSTVTAIGAYAFDECNKLLEVYNKSSLEIKKGKRDNGCIAENAKNVYTNEGGSKIETDHSGLVYYVDGSSKILIDYTGSNSDVIIPSDVSEILEYAFYYRKKLSSITISDSVTEIGYSAFEGCSGLSSITVSERNPIYFSKDNCLILCAEKDLILGCKNSVIPSDGSVEIIDYCAFYKCSGLTDLTIPEGIKEIGSYAFSRCDNLTVVKIPSTVEYMGDGVFGGCRKLKTVIFAEGDYQEGSIVDGFSDCVALENIIIPEGIEYLGDQAFMDCGLRSITLPASLKEIDTEAICDCRNLTEIHYHGTIAEWRSVNRGFNVFNVGKNCKVYCSDGVIPLYEDDDYDY